MKRLTFLLLLLTALTLRAATPTTEIEGLLAYLKGLDGATFVRNGSDHTAVEAEAHLRLKWNKQRADIVTAEDFIALCGSKSSLSGERYQIRFKDGTVRYSDEVLKERLREMRKAANPAATPKPSPPAH